MTLPNTGFSRPIGWSSLGWDCGKHYTITFECPCLTAFQSVVLERYAVSKTALYVRTPVSSVSSYQLIGCCISYGRSRVQLWTFSLPSQ
jgi:hypothetical protein